MGTSGGTPFWLGGPGGPGRGTGSRPFNISDPVTSSSTGTRTARAGPAPVSDVFDFTRNPKTRPGAGTAGVRDLPLQRSIRRAETVRWCAACSSEQHQHSWAPRGACVASWAAACRCGEDGRTLFHVRRTNGNVCCSMNIKENDQGSSGRGPRADQPDLLMDQPIRRLAGEGISLFRGRDDQDATLARLR